MHDEDPAKEEAKLQFNIAKSEARREVEEAKAKSWDNFQEIFTSNSSTSELWQNFNRLSGKKRSKELGLIIDGKHCTNPAEISDRFAEIFAANSATASYPEEFLRKKQRCEGTTIELDDNEESPINDDFTIQELFRALDSTKGTSVGPDEIGYPMLKHLPFHCKVNLLGAFNRIWSSGEIPESWKESVVIPIPKPGGNANCIDNFRPISLTSCISKTFERMVNHRLISHLEDQGSLHHRQFAFRRGKGTSNLFVEIDDIITEAARKGEHCEIVTLDLKKAYDRVWHWNLIKSVVEHKMGSRMNRFINNFLQHRTFRVSFAGHTSKSTFQENGVPQGSVLSVSLFLIAMNSLFSITPRNVQIFLYADDITIIATGKRVGFLRRRLQKAVTAVEKWANSIGFQMSPTKSNTMHCCKLPRHKNWHLEGGKIELYEEEIPRVKSARILGVIFDRKCKFNLHTKQTKEDCRSRLNFLKAISRKADRKTLINIGKATVASKLLYGIEILRKENVEALTPIYNEIMRIASGALRTSPVLPLFVESGCLPFHLQVAITLITKGCSILEKSSGNTNGLWIKARSTFQQLTGESLPLLRNRVSAHDRPWNKKVPTIDWTIKSKIRAGQMPQVAASTFREHVQQTYHQHHLWYTDGSLADGKVGFGIIGPNVRKEGGLPHQCSVFSAEAAALAYATRLVEGPSVIFSDSASCLMALEAGKSRHPYIQALGREAEAKDVTYCWIPGHSGISGNEEADQAANQGRQQERVTKAVPAADIVRWSKTEIWKVYQQTWDSTDRRTTRIVKSTVTKWTDLPNRRDQIVLTRLRLGHTWFTKHHLFEKKPAEVCEPCRRVKNIHHILVSCPQYTPQRQEVDLADNLKEILKNDLESEAKVISYLRKIGMYKFI